MDGLKEWVKARTESILKHKEEAGIEPVMATDLEIMAEIKIAVLDCMRSLYKDGVFSGTSTLNHPALTRKL